MLLNCSEKMNFLLCLGNSCLNTAGPQYYRTNLRICLPQQQSHLLSQLSHPFTIFHIWNKVPHALQYIILVPNQIPIKHHNVDLLRPAFLTVRCDNYVVTRPSHPFFPSQIPLTPLALTARVNVISSWRASHFSRPYKISVVNTQRKREQKSSIILQ